MAGKLTWKQEGAYTESHCGRYCFEKLRGVTADNCRVPPFRLWHLVDTSVPLGHFPSVSEAKAAAQSHLAFWRPDRVEDDGGPTAEDLGHAPGDAD